MHYRLVDGYSEDQEATLWNGQNFPIPSLLKDERGLRVLLVQGEEVPVSLWAVSSLTGVDALYRPNGSWITANEFLELAELFDSEALYRVHEFMWHPGVPSDVFVAQEPVQPQEEASEASRYNVLEAAAGRDPWGPELSSFVHLHTHSEFSALDGLATVEEIVGQAKAQGNTAVAITDHGGCWGHPDFQDECEKQEIKPIFGMEGYLVDDRFNREDSDYYHITLWAMNDKGLHNLWAISTEGYRDSDQGKPCFDWDTLERLNEGVVASSGCLRGPLAREIKVGNVHRAQTNSKRLSDIFGDRYYIELHVNHLEEQIKVNKWLVSHAQEFDIPMIAAVDSHYAHKDQQDDHKVWLATQTAKDVTQETNLFGGGQDYHMASLEEVLDKLSYIDAEVVARSITNTVALADRCDAKIKPKEGMPRFHSGKDAEQKDADQMVDLCIEAWDERVGYKPNQDTYQARFEHEVGLLIPKGFSGYFLMNADLVKHAKDNGILVGPGRGSGAGSLVAYLLGITEVDPVENDLLFERFMTEGRTALPDFDIDYPSSKKQIMRDYAERRWGKKHVCAVGTVTRLKNKGAFKKTAAAISSRLPEGYFTDVERISKIIGAAEASTAGLGLKWDELMDQCEEEFEPFQRKYPYLFEMAAKFRGRVATYSRHAAGLILDPQTNLEGALPMMRAEDDNGNVFLVTQFDKDTLEKLGYVKFDFLNLRNLDTLQIALDLIKNQTGETINVYKWRDEYHDAKVFEEITKGWTLGLFQIETALGTRTVKQLKPANLNDLADCITLGRPGPIRSGLDKTYFARREGRQKVSFPDQRLATVLARSYGTMIYQEDIMATCIVLANYTDNEADGVRKILGKKEKDKAEAAGKVFIAKAVENNTSRLVAQALWDQMAQFALYSFNRAHAFAYAMLAYWTGWFKLHYPVQFIAACLSTVEKEEIPIFVSESRRLGCRVLPPDINISGFGFVNTEDTVRYGLDSIKGVAQVATGWITTHQPFTSWDDFMERRDTEKCDMGVVKKLAHVGAFDSLYPNRRALEISFAEDDLPRGERCIFFQLEPINKYNDLPCGFDWDSLPLITGRTGKPTKNQDKRKPPAKCSKACRRYTPREFDASTIDFYTEAEIRQIEMETLGVCLSSSPFDVIPEEDREMLLTADQLQAEEAGTYLAAVLVQKVKLHQTKGGKTMAFVTADTPSGSIDITVFSDKFTEYGSSLLPGSMALVELKKNDRGVTLGMMERL